MDDSTIENQFEERVELEQAIASGIASLSASPAAPTEVDATQEFSAADVIFDGGIWLDFVVRVQDWLRLDVVLNPLAPSSELAATLFRGLGVARPVDLIVESGDDVLVTEAGLDLLRVRVDRAVQLRDRFLEALEEGTHSAASAGWLGAWEEMIDETVSGPILAKAGVWSIHDFASRAKSRRLDLSPSYQRGDVWPTRDAQLLIESILRGIPLPSVIILRPKSLGDAPFEVVDGKQRLTSILRFIGAHPTAIENVERAAREYPGFELGHLYRTDYPRFRVAWRRATGEVLTSTREREYYFPFKLATVTSGLTGDLARFAGQYYHSIMSHVVRVGGEQVEVRDIFESTTDYKVPVIEYTEATPRQIHEVFSLYNKQGKHLNAEEIRNAVYHELDLMRALALAAGDAPRTRGMAPFLTSITPDLDGIEAFFADAGVTDSRYRRTKVLSWLFSLLFVESLNDAGEPRRLSTAQQINGLLDRAQITGDPMRDGSRIRDALHLVARAMDAHAAADAWSDAFKDGKAGGRWQDLQLVASLLGVAIATAALGEGVNDRLKEASVRLRHLTSTDEWRRPRKTQTAEQWRYIASVSLGILRELNVDPLEAQRAITERFVFSTIGALQQIVTADGSMDFARIH